MGIGIRKKKKKKKDRTQKVSVKNSGAKNRKNLTNRLKSLKELVALGAGMK